MPNEIDVLFGNANVLTIIGVFALNLFWVAVVVFVKKEKVPTKLFVFNVLLQLAVFADFGLVDTTLGYIIMVFSAGMATVVYASVFMGELKDSTSVLSTYLVFFSLLLLFQGTAVLSNSNFSELVTGSPTTAKLSLNCDGWGLFACTYNTAKQIFGLFNFSSAPGIFNVVLLGGFMAFLGLYVVNFIRG